MVFLWFSYGFSYGIIQVADAIGLYVPLIPVRIEPIEPIEPQGSNARAVQRRQRCQRHGDVWSTWGGSDELKSSYGNMV